MNSLWRKLKYYEINAPFLLALVIFSTLSLKHVADTLQVFVSDGLYFSITSSESLLLLSISLLFVAVFFIIGFGEKNTVLIKKTQQVTSFSFILSMTLVWLSDMGGMALSVKTTCLGTGFMNYGKVFSETLSEYFYSMKFFYGILFLMVAVFPFFLEWFEKKYFELSYRKFVDDKDRKHHFFILNSLNLGFPLVFLLFPFMCEVYIFASLSHVKPLFFENLTPSFRFFLNIGYLFFVLLLMTYAIFRRKNHSISLTQLVKLIKNAEKMAFLMLLFQILFSMFLFINPSHEATFKKLSQFTLNFKETIFACSPNFFLIFSLFIAKEYFKRKQADDDAPVEQTTGNFGTASWMSEKEMFEKGCFDVNTGPIFGTTADRQTISLPLCNTLTLGPPGMGKSLMYIATLLKDSGPKFVWDIKGELFLTTARYRSEVMGRRVILLDFYNILSPFISDWPSQLNVINRINPFDYIPEEESARDRMLISFASSFVVSDSDHSGAAKHFDENAKILIRGYIDYIIKTIPNKEERTLKTLYLLMCESQIDAEQTFIQMQEVGGHAQAAANQILRVASQERGSIFSTAYRQIDWLSDINIQQALSESTFDLTEFLNGQMDIYFVLPQEQVHEKSRLFRIVLSLLKSMITQTDPRNLPRAKMMFMMDEIAQLGYCPDIEQFIEVMRSFKVVVWAAFQTLSQVKLYKKPDLFLGAPIKQFFTSNDVETVKWIQDLAGKKTIKTKSLSSGKSDTFQKMKTFSGNVSKSEGENVHETGVNLINANEIREMSMDEQLIFWSGHKPLRCKKIFYYKHPYFEGRFKENPFE